MNNPKVLLSTKLGSITIELYPDKAPVSVANFLKYVDSGRYENAHLFRIVTLENQRSSRAKDEGNAIKIEVVQGGLKPEDKNLLPPIDHEPTNISGLKHLDGTISMARFEPGSANGSFFFCVGDQPELDYGGARYEDGLGFAAFGQIVENREVLNTIFNRAESQEYLVNEISCQIGRLTN